MVIFPSKMVIFPLKRWGMGLDKSQLRAGTFVDAADLVGDLRGGVKKVAPFGNRRTRNPQFESRLPFGSYIYIIIYIYIYH